jgi:hypothetical protein
MNPFRRFPLTTLITWGTTVLALLVVLQSAHVLTGPEARWVDAAAGLLQVILTAYARQHTTPVAAPRDAYGRRLVPAPGEALIPPQK